MNRIVVLDTETTGLEVSQGHRVIEIGCVEVVDRCRSGRTFQHYLNPDRRVDAGALAIHGLDDTFLAEQPHFTEIAEAFIAFVNGADVVIHNAIFDCGFLDAELARLNPEQGPLRTFASVIIDTLPMARECFPGQRNSLDALCKRFDIDNSNRQQHGALLDAELLADVYLALTAGQTTLNFNTATQAKSHQVTTKRSTAHFNLRVLRATTEECAQHETRLDALEKSSTEGALWRHSDFNAS